MKYQSILLSITLLPSAYGFSGGRTLPSKLGRWLRRSPAIPRDRVVVGRASEHESVSNRGTTRTELDATSTDQALPADDGPHRKERGTVSKWFMKYLKWSEHHPYRTKAISASVIVSLGAILSQWIQALSAGTPLVLDWHVVRSFALTGFIFEGPYLHWWYEQLFRFGRFLQHSQRVPSSRVRTLVQITIDETIGVAIFFPTYFLAYEVMQSLLLLREPTLSAVSHRMSTELLDVVKTNYLVWPISSYIIFRRVPEALRVVASSIVAVFWNAYLCARIA